MKDTFADYHPFINLIYFVLVIAFSLVLSHPLVQVVALVCATTYAISIEGKKSVMFLLKFCLPMALITAFINPAFNHRGSTILLYLPTGNPLTLESILYGLSTGVMIITLIIWFSSFNRVMTSDKFIYLFGKIIPSLSLVLSMSLRFVPKFKLQMATVSETQRSIGRDVSSGSLLKRTKTAIIILSIMITWALENAIETADSMKSRGYGLKGRTAFSIYRFDNRDKYTLIWFLLCTIILIVGMILSAFEFRYFPNIRSAKIGGRSVLFYFVHFALCITPFVVNLSEEIRWKTLVSKI